MASKATEIFQVSRKNDKEKGKGISTEWWKTGKQSFVKILKAVLIDGRY